VQAIRDALPDIHGATYFDSGPINNFEQEIACHGGPQIRQIWIITGPAKRRHKFSLKKEK